MRGGSHLPAPLISPGSNPPDASRSASGGLFARFQLTQQNRGKNNGKADHFLQAGAFPVEQHGESDAEHRLRAQDE